MIKKCFHFFLLIQLVSFHGFSGQYDSVFVRTTSTIVRDEYNSSFFEGNNNLLNLIDEALGKRLTENSL